MKYCMECGAKLADDAIFCEECGTKQADLPQDNKRQDEPVTKANFQTEKKNGKLKFFITIAVVALLFTAIVSGIRSCATPHSLEDVASEFAEAMFIDFQAKKAVSLMSEDLINSYLDQMNFSSKKEFTERLDYTLNIRKKDTIQYYGEDWEAEIVDVEVQEVIEGLAIVVIIISHEGSDALWHTNLDEHSIYLTKENDEWRVYDFKG